MNTGRSNSFWLAVTMVVISTLAAVLFVFAIDRVAGRWVRDPRLTAGLLFPPQVEVAMKAYEYQYAVKTNELGLRDHPYDLNHRPKVLVAAIGDSFTFGQGVDLEDVWVERVEKALRVKGLDVEILNFGQPGSSPPYFARLAEESLAVVKPDLTLVNILQTEDLLRIDPAHLEDTRTYRRDPWGRAMLRKLFPNLTDLAYREHAQLLAQREGRSEGNWNLMKMRWQDDFNRIFKDFDGPSREAFKALPAPVRKAFREGELHPFYLKQCDAKVRAQRQRDVTLPVDSTETQARIAITAECLQRIEAVNKTWGGRAVVLSLPSLVDNDPFAKRIWHETYGSAVTPIDGRADEAIHQSAQRAGLPSDDVTAAFRAAAAKEELFYPLDAHLNKRGNEVLAELMAPIIEKYVRDVAAKR